VCLPGQQWTEASIWFDDGISTFHSFVAVDLCSLFMSGVYCPSVFWCPVARISELELGQGTNIKFIVKLGKSESELREMLVQVYGATAMSVTEEENIAKVCQIA
jgi:hypothetical protein